MKKAIFFDRDGTLIEDRHYLSTPVEIRLKKGVIETLHQLQSRGYKFFIVSNQSGIKRGYFSFKRACRIMRELEKILKSENITVSGIYFCPHHPGERCGCRKPGVALIKRILDKYPDINLSSSYFVGDKKEDVEAGKKMGMKTVVFNSSVLKIPIADFCIQDFRELLKIIP